VQSKREAQKRIAEQLATLSREEQVAFFRYEAATGELGEWWQRLRETRTSSPETDAE
jgi:type IV pilus biogenesis protein CpaD/CtpE